MYQFTKSLESFLMTADMNKYYKNDTSYDISNAAFFEMNQVSNKVQLYKYIVDQYSVMFFDQNLTNSTLVNQTTTLTNGTKVN